MNDIFDGVESRAPIEINAKGKSKREERMEELLREFVERNDWLHCDYEISGCGCLNCRTRRILEEK